jgi:hypothetical protein
MPVVSSLSQGLASRSAAQLVDTYGPMHSRRPGSVGCEVRTSETCPGSRLDGAPPPRQAQDLVAIARWIRVIIWRLLAYPTARFHGLAADYHTTRIDATRETRSLVASLKPSATPSPSNRLRVARPHRRPRTGPRHPQPHRMDPATLGCYRLLGRWSFSGQVGGVGERVGDSIAGIKRRQPKHPQRDEPSGDSWRLRCVPGSVEPAGWIAHATVDGFSNPIGVRAIRYCLRCGQGTTVQITVRVMG